MINVVPMLTAYSAMSLTYNGTTNGNTFYSTASYSVAYVSTSTIKVAINSVSQSGGGPNYGNQLTAWVLKNGSVIAVYTSGYNLTGTQGSQIAISVFASFIVEAQAGQSVTNFVSSPSVHSTGTSQVTLGPTSMTVTNYALSGSATISTACSTDNLQNLTLSVGTPPGANYALITSLTESGSFVSNGQTTNGSIVLKMTSVTVA